MSTDYRRKVLKPLVMNAINCYSYEPDEYARLCSDVNGVFNGDFKYLIINGIADTKIILEQSPKSQKRIRITK